MQQAVAIEREKRKREKRGWEQARTGKQRSDEEMSEGERRGEESMEERMASRKSSMFSVASRRSSMATVEEDPTSMTLEQDRERKGVASSCGREVGDTHVQCGAVAEQCSLRISAELGVGDWGGAGDVQDDGWWEGENTEPWSILHVTHAARRLQPRLCASSEPHVVVWEGGGSEEGRIAQYEKRPVCHKTSSQNRNVLSLEGLTHKQKEAKEEKEVERGVWKDTWGINVGKLPRNGDGVSDGKEGDGRQRSSRLAETPPPLHPHSADTHTLTKSRRAKTQGERASMDALFRYTHIHYICYINHRISYQYTRESPKQLSKDLSCYVYVRHTS